MAAARVAFHALIICAALLVRGEESSDGVTEMVLLQSRTTVSRPLGAEPATVVAPAKLNEPRDAAVDLMAEDDDEDDDEHEDESDLERIMRIARLADTNNDAMLSTDELRAFAEGVRKRHRTEQTSDLLKVSDKDASGYVTLDELPQDVSLAIAAHQEARFEAADANRDGRLGPEEFHSYSHPATDGDVIDVERAHHMWTFDVDRNGFVDFEEFRREGLAHDSEGFSETVARSDFNLHDHNGDGKLCEKEFEHLLLGHSLLRDSIEQTIASVDKDGDGHIHLEHEVPTGLAGLLDSEFIEDYFFHELHDLHAHDEL